MSNLTKLAAGQTCTFRLPGCLTENVVLCHYRRAEWAGTAMKPNDLVAAWGCSNCHDLVDRRAKLNPLYGPYEYLNDFTIDAAFGRAMARTLTALVDQLGIQPAELVQMTARRSKGRTATPRKPEPDPVSLYRMKSAPKAKLGKKLPAGRNNKRPAKVLERT